MEITKIYSIKSTLHLASAYIVNGDKTDVQLLVALPNATNLLLILSF